MSGRIAPGVFVANFFNLCPPTTKSVSRRMMNAMKHLEHGKYYLVLAQHRKVVKGIMTAMS